MDSLIPDILAPRYALSIAPGYASDLAVRYVIPAMKTVEEVRRERLKLLRDEFGSLSALNAKLELGSRDSTLSQYLNGSTGTKTKKPKEMGSAMARRLEAACGKDAGWMDTDPALTGDTSQEVQHAQLPPDLSELVAEWRDIPPWKRAPILERIREAAEQSRDEKAYYLAETGSKKNTLTAELRKQPTTSRSKLVVSHGDGNPKQTPLPLTPASNPFDPHSAPANEIAWYRSLAGKPKAADE